MTHILVEALTPGSVTDACMKDEMQTNAMYANITGMAGETCLQKYGPLNARSVDGVTKIQISNVREYKEENSWDDDNKSTDDVDRPIPGVLEPTT